MKGWYVACGTAVWLLAGGAMFGYVSEIREGKLKVYFLDVGQGDAIYIEAPNGVQVLVDGGPNRGVLRELGRSMPFYDRSLDMLIVTNPDKDHMAGFIDVLERYEVSAIMEPGTVTDTDIYARFAAAVEEEAARRLVGRSADRLVLDPAHEVYLDIFFPDQDVSGWKTNDGSLVARLIYGNTSFLLTGDAPVSTERLILRGGSLVDVDVLKVGHHGSRTSTGEELLAAATPAYAVVSSGKNNPYGHPHPEVISRLQEAGVATLRTDTIGTIRMESDGKRIRIKRKTPFGVFRRL